ncbi:diguanylate cyclase (GGDEF) domain-containing protein [Malonomonas rubra DSM 5091]|uniref:diguanylate cyclase n=1 Tax=Malonomonas rubra DSM 5091 TaxID=1122189 RepID=A0A1M6IIU9_MALRU|nr:diguanylate cyclase [Malonomonas rubra]SHJ34356.1 diguanylate cyclase (GGDEF) domain-containing protein [Malonomonas rubra DSM 5091]
MLASSIKSMLPKNKRVLLLAAVTLAVAMISLQVLFYVTIQREVMGKAQETVTNVLHIQQAIRGYVETVLRPEAYRLQEQDILAADYFSPEMMSRSFVSRETLNIFSQLHNETFPDFIFRYSSKSPLNLINQATDDELALFDFFDQRDCVQPDGCSELSEVRYISGREHLFYALPLGRFKQECLKCHGDPADAPKALTDRYGRTHGFQRNVGELSGIMSIALDLTPYRQKGWQVFALVGGLNLIIFTTVFIFFWRMLRTKDCQDRLLLQKNDELARLSSIDTLTGLWNRLQFDREIIRSMALAKRQGESLALILLDLDYFKNVNDKYGHSVGDEALKCFADFLRRACRKSDFVGRYGGEEFIIMAPQMDEAELVEYAKRLLEEMVSVDYPYELNLTASLGLALMQADEDADRFFCRADNALYVSKAEGRYRYTLADRDCSKFPHMPRGKMNVHSSV